MKPLSLFMLFFCLAYVCFAQSTNNLKSTLLSFKAININFPIEKLYLHTDKPYYTSGDTLRFKAYLFSADYLTPSMQSGLLYIELDGMDNAPVKKMMVPVSAGFSWGDIALDEKDIPAGTYTLRAYTNWMRNFGEVYVFEQQVNISSVTGSILIKTNFKLQQKAGKQNIEAVLKLTALDGQIQPLQDIQLKVMDGKKNLSKDKVSTGVDGVVKINFDVPEKTNTSNLSIKLQQTGKDGELTIPVVVSRPEHTDLQFMPEGGSLVAGIPAKAGFKAISEDGQGVKVSGTIVDSKQQQVAAFASVHDGMGTFEFKPKAGETYFALLNLPDGSVKSYPLPAVISLGTSLRITANNNDSLTISLNSTLINNGECYLIGQSRGVVCYAEKVNFNGSRIKKQVDKSLFPTGIARFTLLNAQHQPLNERIVYINHHDELQIAINTNQQQYAIRDSIALTIQIKDKDGQPVHGSFSLAITDDSQVKTDSIGSNILNNLLLTSDLKGNIESPGYYFTGNKAAELDNLMLTQGWVGYDWKDVFYPKAGSPEFAAEKEFTVKGTVTNVFNKPIEKSQIILVANHPLLFKDTLSDRFGRFTFNGLFPVDTAIFKLQARNRHGRDNNVRISTENIKPFVFSTSSTTMPWYVNSDTSLLKNMIIHIAELKAINSYNGEGKVLKEVTIKEKKIIKGSKNLNGPGEADQILDEKDIEKADKMSLHDLLQQKIKGFNIGAYPTLAPKRLSYRIFTDEIHFVIDGIDLDFFYDFTAEGPPLDLKRYTYTKGVLDYITAEDVIGIEVMTSDKYFKNYKIQYNLPGPYIEITTRAKQGQFMKTTPGTYLYKTLAFTLPKQFYSPKYIIKNKNTAIGTDLRSTIYWAPNIITDKEGKAFVSFYSADKAGTYTITVEGTDMDGNLGYQRQKIKIYTSDSKPK